MFRRSRGDKAKEGAVNATELAIRLAQDKKFRKLLVSGISHGSAATRRARSNVGLLGTLLRVAQDDTLARELKSARADLERAYGRAEKGKRGRTLRKLLLLGAIAGAARSSTLRQKITSAIARVTGSGPSPSPSRPHSLDDLTKDELYQRAQEADIPGRSEMSKDELVAALRERG